MARKSWGSIRAIGKGVWELRWPRSPDPDTGKRRQGSEVVRGSRKAAETRLAELRAEFGGGIDRTQGITVATCWERYYFPSLKHLAATTRDRYQGHYNVSIGPLYGDMPMEAIPPYEVQRNFSEMTYGKAASAHRIMRAFFNYAENIGLITTNVMKRTYKLPEKSPETTARRASTDVFSWDELVSIYEEGRGETWEEPFILAAFAGCRREEACGVRVGEIIRDGEFATIELRRGVKTGKGGIPEIGKLKNESSYRTIAVMEPFASRLLELQDEYRRLGYIWMHDDGFGQPIKPETMSQSYSRWLERNGYRPIPFKNLRNSLATAMHSAGVDLKMIAKMYGHTTDHITYKNYSRPELAAFKYAMSKFRGEASEGSHPTSSHILEFPRRKTAD